MYLCISLRTKKNILGQLNYIQYDLFLKLIRIYDKKNYHETLQTVTILLIVQGERIICSTSKYSITFFNMINRIKLNNVRACRKLLLNSQLHNFVE